MRIWEFEIGDCVDHISGGMPAVVLDRAMTASGRENYSVRLLDIGDRRRDRLLRREFMTRSRIGDRHCIDCRFLKGDRCCLTGE
jgi:hypothetical protein